MRINIEADENIIASLPKVWQTEPGFIGFFTKSREGILVLTNKKIAFVPKFVFLTPRDREKFFEKDEARVIRMDNYSEIQLDEDLTEQAKSSLVPLKSIDNVETIKLRNVNFLRITFRTHDEKTKKYDFGITKSVTNYPIRQPMMFYSLNWDPWVKLIKAYL